MKHRASFTLRLPMSLKKFIAEISKEEGTSINQFVASAVAEKVSALKTAEFFASRRSRADLRTFDKIMRRKGGERPREGDEL